MVKFSVWTLALFVNSTIMARPLHPNTTVSVDFKNTEEEELVRKTSTKLPQWDSLEHDNIFTSIIPRKFETYNEIDMSLKMNKDPKILNVTFSTDSGESVAQVSCNYVTKYVSLTPEANYSIQTYEIPTDDICIVFRIKEDAIFTLIGEHIDNLQIELETIPIKHELENIRYMSISGDIEKVVKLNFMYEFNDENIS